MPKNEVLKKINRSYTDRPAGTVVMGAVSTQEVSTHDPVTLDPDSAPELTLAVQKLKLAEVLTPTEHTTIGDSSPHHAAVTEGNGIAVSGQQVSIDGSDPNTWTGNQTFEGNNIYRHLVPQLTDTYDIGSELKYWRNQWVSQIMATIFAENTIQLIGGQFMIPKSTGTLPAVATADALIDFGQAMTPGDHLLIKAQDTGGAYKTEYILIGELDSGTTYNVTRDEAAAHATDPAWAEGTPYAVLGQDGNGRIELSAVSTPRISILEQGADYNDQVEVVRIGDLDGLLDYTSEIYGIYIGASDKAYLTATPTDGLRIETPTGGLILDDTGLSLHCDDSVHPESTITFVDVGGEDIATLTALEGAGGFNRLSIDVLPVADQDAELFISATSDTEHKQAYIYMYADDGVSSPSIEIISAEDSVVLGSDIVRFYGNLSSYKNSADNYGYIFVPFRATSTSWDGDLKYDANNGVIDLSAVFGLPAGIKAIEATLQVACATVGKTVTLGASSAYRYQLVQETQVANAYISNTGKVTCDANGDVYFWTDAVTAAKAAVYLVIYGYYI